MPFFGIEPAIVDPITGEELSGGGVEGVLAVKKPWPSMARTIWGDHQRYLDTYFNTYKGFYVCILFGTYPFPLHTRPPSPPFPSFPPPMHAVFATEDRLKVAVL